MNPITTREKLIELLNMAACPAIFGKGVIVRDELHGEIEQCQFCYERDQAIAALQAAEPVGWVWDFLGQTNFTAGAHHKEVLEDDGVTLKPVFLLPCPPAKAQVPMFRSSADGEHWPRIGCKYLVKLNGVLQEEIFEFDQGDDGAFSGGEYFWSRDDLDECPAFNADADEWLPLSALLTSATAKAQDTLQRFENEAPVLPVVNARFEVVDGVITGTTEVPVKRVEVEDDGSLTVVIDHWPEQSGLSKAQVPEGLRVGNLVTMNQDEYPGLGEWFTQIWCGDDVVARIYGKDREQIRERIDAMLTTSPAVQGEPVGWQYYQFGKWWNGDNLTRGQQKSIKEAGHPIRELYAAPQPSPDVSALVEALELARDYVVEHLTKRREEFKGYEKLGGIAEIEADLAMIEEAIAYEKEKD